jgi:hypothetical protein
MCNNFHFNDVIMYLYTYSQSRFQPLDGGFTEGLDGACPRLLLALKLPPNAPAEGLLLGATPLLDHAPE